MISLSTIRSMIGKTRDEVKSIIGEPNDISIGTRRYPLAMVFKYGIYELHFMPYKQGKCIFVMDSTNHLVWRN